MNNILWMALAGVGAYLLSKKNQVIAAVTPIVNQVENNPIVSNVLSDVIHFGVPTVEPTVILPDPTNVTTNPNVDSNPVVVNPISSVSTQPQGVVIFTEDYNVPDGPIDPGTGTFNGLVAHGWGIDAPPNIAGREPDGTPSMQIMTDPQVGKMIRMAYYGYYEGLQPFHADGSYNTTIDWFNMRLYRDYPKTKRIHETYMVRYSPMDRSQPWGFGDVAAKQHYWRCNQCQSPVVFDVVTNYMWGVPEMIAGYQCCDSSGSQDSNSSQPMGGGYPSLAHINMLDEQWHHVEGIYVAPDAHAKNGSVDLWIDGIQTVHTIGVCLCENDAWFDGIHLFKQGSRNMYRDEANWVVMT